MSESRRRGSRAIEIMTRLYALAVYVAPSDFRQAHGDEMTALLRAQLTDLTGTQRLTAFARAMGDALVRSAYERWRRRGRSQPLPEDTMSTFWSDLRLATRTLIRQKGSAGLVVLTLALAVAANSAVFTLLDALFLQTLPFSNAQRLVYINEQAPRWNLDFTGINYPDFVTWRARATAFESMGLWTDESLNLVQNGKPERVRAARVTYDLPVTLGIRPTLGRSFTREEDQPGGARVVMLGAGLWRTEFASDPQVVGKTLRVDSEPYTIIGVLPEEAEFPSGAQLWLPLGEDPAQAWQSYSYDGVARLRPGATLAQGRASLLQAHEAVWRDHDRDKVVSPKVLPLRDRYVADFRPMGAALGVGVFLVLLIACANVAGAMLARATFRQREMAMRRALGASPSRIVRLLLTEALVLAGVAGVLGSVVGQWGIRSVALAADDRFPRWITLDPNPRTIAFAIGIVVLSALGFGLAPALQLRRADLRSPLTTDGRSSTARGQRRVLDALVVVENGLASILLVAAFLLTQAYRQVQQLDAGFDSRGVATFRVSLPAAKYRNGNEQAAFYRRLTERVRGIQGVTGVGAITCPPFTCHRGNFFVAEGGPAQGSSESDPVVLTLTATPGYFAAMGIRLVRGRFFAEDEGGPGRGAPVVVNESFARRMWPGDADPTGHRIRFRGDSTAPWMTVVGVARDVRHYGLDQPSRPGIYMSTTSMDSANTVGSLAFVVRTNGDASSLGGNLRAAVADLDPELPLYGLSTMERELDRSLALRRMLATALLAFAAVALVLAVGGVYAVLSYLIGRRRREIGIRMALGAREGQVITMLMRQGGWLVLIGVALGLPAALLVARSLAGQLAGVSGRDPLTYIAAAVVLMGTGLLAALVPARRAARVQPTETISEA